MLLEVIRSLTAPPERVWRAFTDPAALAAWFWPARFRPAAEIDLRPGGRWRLTGPGAGLAVAGEYVEVDPPGRLVFTWRWEGEDEQSLVTLTLKATGGGTDLRLVHERLAGAGNRDNHAQGWHDCLDRLPAWLDRLPAGLE